jgi:hypothetical protein
MQAVLRAKEGAPSLPPGRYFRMHMIGYLEGLDSERGIVWRCSDSRSLGDFLRLGKRDKVPDQPRLSKTRSHLPHEVHEKVFAFVLNLVAKCGLVKANALTSMVRRWRPTPHDLVAWSLCKACLDVEFASIMSLERISRARVHSSG